jgi:putative phosphoribosyl transferase
MRARRTKRPIDVGEEEMMDVAVSPRVEVRETRIHFDRLVLTGELGLPVRPRGLVILLREGGQRSSIAQRRLARHLRDRSLGTLLVRLLTSEEEGDGVLWSLTPMEVLAQRIRAVSEWMRENAANADLSVGYLGAGATIEAMLRAGAGAPRPSGVVAIGAAPVPRLPFLAAVEAPTLLLVEQRDPAMLEINRKVLEEIGAREKALVVVPRSEARADDANWQAVARLAGDWLCQHVTCRVRRGDA